MLNWRRDPDVEERLLQLQNERALIESETEQLVNETEQLVNESEQIRRETEQIKRETEQLKRETEQLRRENARNRILLSYVEQLCSLPDSSSIPMPPTAPD